MVPLGRTNKATGGVKLFPTTILFPDMYTVAVFCALLNTQRPFFTASGWFNPPSASHPPHPPPALPPPIELIHDIGGVQKKVSQNPAV